MSLSRSDELWVYDQVYLWIIIESYLNSFIRLSYLCKSLRIICLVWPTRLIFLAMGEVLIFGFNPAVFLPSDKKGPSLIIFASNLLLFASLFSASIL